MKPKPRRFLMAYRGEPKRVFSVYGYGWATLMTRAEAEKELERIAGSTAILECLPVAPAKAKRTRGKKK